MVTKATKASWAMTNSLREQVLIVSLALQDHSAGILTCFAACKQFNKNTGPAAPQRLPFQIRKSLNNKA
jgi:hypothetical protein